MRSAGQSSARLVVLGRQAFTLVELLVVVGIIAVLIAIVAPAIGMARAESRTVHCGNNVRQLALALVAYCGQSKGKFPPNISAPVPGQFWYDDARIGSFIPAPRTGSVPDNTAYACPDDDGTRRSYAMNLWASCKVDSIYLTTPPKGTLWAPHAKRASELLLLLESWSYIGPAGWGYAAQPTVGSFGDAGKSFGGGGGIAPPFLAGHRGWVNCELDYSRHRRRGGPGEGTQPRGRINIAFADAHVELVSNDALVTYLTGVATGRAYWSPIDMPSAP